MKITRWSLLIVALLFGAAVFAETAPKTWSSAWTSEGGNHTGLQLIGVDQSKTGMSGHFKYYNIPNGAERVEPVVIAGKTSTDGSFWADATIQVRKNDDSTWETIGKVKEESQPNTMEVAPNASSGVFMINFDSLKPFMHTHKWGRVIISTRASAEFELTALAPP